MCEPQHEPGQRRAKYRVNITPQFHPLFRPENLMSMPPGRMLCLVSGCAPFFTQVPGYWEMPFGRGLDPNPYYRPQNQWR